MFNTNSNPLSKNATTFNITFSDAQFLRAPPSVKPISSIEAKIYKVVSGESYPVESATLVTPYAPVAGVISVYSLTSTSYQIGTEATYTFSIQLTSPLKTDGYIQINFPSEITIMNDVSDVTPFPCSVTQSTPKSASCYRTAQSTILVKGGFQTDPAAGSVIQIQIPSLKNPTTPYSLNYFDVITFYNSEPYTTDSTLTLSESQKLKFPIHPGYLSNTAIAASNQMANQLSSY